MRISDFISAMLGLFIFIICPILLFRKIDSIFTKWSIEKEKHKQNKQEKVFMAKYSTLIEKGIDSYHIAQQLIDSHVLLGLYDWANDEDPQILYHVNEIVIALPILDVDLEYFWQSLSEYKNKNLNKVLYNGRDIIEYFTNIFLKYCKNLIGYEDERMTKSCSRTLAINIGVVNDINDAHEIAYLIYKKVKGI